MPTISVAGDLTVDWSIVVPAGSSTHLATAFAWERSADVHITALPGGAAMVHALLVAAGQPELTVNGPTLPERAMLDPADGSIARSFAIWQPQPRTTGDGGVAWRMARFLGQRGSGSSGAGLSAKHVAADVLVIDDAGLGFRATSGVSDVLAHQSGQPRRVIVKMAAPLGEGPLWNDLVAHLGDRITLYCAVGDLRREHAPIGQPLSWELTASEVVEAVRARHDLCSVAEIVVSLGHGGAVVVPRTGDATLVYDPRHQEGDWAARHPGLATGLGTCVVAALALNAARDPEQSSSAAAVGAGILAARALHERGLEVPPPSAPGAPALPLADVAAALADTSDDTFHRVEIPGERTWRILAAVAPAPNVDLATRLALDGDGAVVRGIPVERMGTWASLDRVEIESMRSVRAIVREYLSLERRSRPLSIAVFGPPGSGQELRDQADGEGVVGRSRADRHARVQPLPVLRPRRPRDRPPARPRPGRRADPAAGLLGRVRQHGSAGVELGWLVRFLAPMQDGVFLERGATQPVGPAIFVFAGGTHATMASFKTRAVEVPGAKATDFLSRLRGYVDVLGPNPSGPDDITAPLRRALLLRTLVRGKAPQLLDRDRLAIDPGVLRAFLGVATYVHGARSMESIVDMSALAGLLRFERSALPAPHQLGLHVDPDEFLRLVAS